MALPGHFLFFGKTFLRKYFTTLTNYLQNGGRNQVSVPIFDLIHAVVPGSEPGDDHLIDGAIPAQ